ncbi:MAG: hypothetical protein HY289_09995 [Planctomycetes bacterium]|nr:hypothetical protein [Planctomycetota bacterium]
MAITKKPQKDSVERALAAEQQAFRKQHAQLMARYEGEYVALHLGRVIAHGPDDEELAQSLYAKLGDKLFYIAKVEREPTICEVPSPELES